MNIDLKQKKIDELIKASVLCTRALMSLSYKAYLRNSFEKEDEEKIKVTTNLNNNY